MSAPHFNGLRELLRNFLPLEMEEKDPIEQKLSQTWWMVPPDEKSKLLQQAQAYGVEFCCIVMVLCCTVAFSLRFPWLMLGIALLTPVLYQTTASRLWTELKAKTTIRYFFASETAKRFALTLDCDSLSLAMIFQGTTQTIEQENSGDTPLLPFPEENTSSTTSQKNVWISLFSNSLFVVSESDTGPVLECGIESLEHVSLSLETPNEESGSVFQPFLTIKQQDPEGELVEWIIQSPFPDTLRMCELRFKALTQELLPDNPSPQIEESNEALHSSI
jgi:hypothetical protein